MIAAVGRFSELEAQVYHLLYAPKAKSLFNGATVDWFTPGEFLGLRQEATRGVRGASDATPRCRMR